MTTLQRIIKYLAIAFALFLAVSIVGGILGGVALLSNLTGSSGVAENMQSLSFSGEIRALEMEIGALEIKIQSGDTFSVETNSEDVSCEVSNGTLVIREQRHFLRLGKVGRLVVTVPEGFVFEEAELEFGAGAVDIDHLSAGKLDLNLGAGEVNIRSLTVTDKADIEGGAGEITIHGSSLANLNLDMGVGQLTLASRLTGSSEVHFGLGSAELVLTGSLEDYRIRLDKGLGSATIAGDKMEDGVTYGTGSSFIDMEGGVGQIRILFEQSSTA